MRSSTRNCYQHSWASPYLKSALLAVFFHCQHDLEESPFLLWAKSLLESMKLPGKSPPRLYVCWSGIFRKCLQIWAYLTPPQSHYWQVTRTQPTPRNRYLRIRSLRHYLRPDNSHEKGGENAGRSNITSCHPFFPRFHQVRNLFSTLPQRKEYLPGSPLPQRLCSTPC